MSTMNFKDFIKEDRRINWEGGCPQLQASCDPDKAARHGKSCPPLKEAMRPFALNVKGNPCFPQRVLDDYQKSNGEKKLEVRDMVIKLAKYAAYLEDLDCSIANNIKNPEDRNGFCGFIRTKDGKKKCEIKNTQCTEIQSKGGTNSSSDGDSDTENLDELFDSSSDVEESGSGNLLQKGIQVVTDVLNKAFTGEEGVLNDTIHDDMLNVMNDTRTYPNTLREK
jgi:hypothetical protein